MTTMTPASALPLTPARTVYTTVESPIGTLLLVGEWTDPRVPGFALTRLSAPGRHAATVQSHWRRDPAAFAEAEGQLRAYFAGELKQFRLPLAPAGTPFRRAVWEALDRVPLGTTTTYRQLAGDMGSPSAARAVGGAVGANPLLVIRPCHRVIGSDGSLTGYAAGLDRKRHLLALEGIQLP